MDIMEELQTASLLDFPALGLPTSPLRETCELLTETDASISLYLDDNLPQSQVCEQQHQFSVLSSSQPGDIPTATEIINNDDKELCSRCSCRPCKCDQFDTFSNSVENLVASPSVEQQFIEHVLHTTASEGNIHEGSELPRFEEIKTPECSHTQHAAQASANVSTAHAAATKSEACHERRSSRKRTISNGDFVYISCPSCSQKVKSSDLSIHLERELNKLNKLARYRKNYVTTSNSTTKTVRSSSSAAGDQTEEMDSHTRYKSYLNVRTRRERRAKKRQRLDQDEETTCPVCNELIVGPEEELAEHVEQCLKQQEDGSGEELDVEDQSYEEYTWAGQTRIRASTLLEGGLAASGFATSKGVESGDDVDLDIDGDNTNIYGGPQYTEADLIPCCSEEPEEEKERKALRRAVLKADGVSSRGNLPKDRQRWNIKSSLAEDKRVMKNCENDNQSQDQVSSEIVESLKAKIREQQIQLEKLERPKCLICMDWYTKPLTSVMCWHVHCEECWLRTLGTKKLCPQCNTITSPADLRRIYF